MDPMGTDPNSVGMFSPQVLDPSMRPAPAVRVGVLSNRLERSFDHGFHPKYLVANGS